MRRYVIAAAVAVIEILLGFQYTWGIFDRLLQERHGFSASQAQSVLAAQIVMFAVTFPLAGWVLHHYGPRVTAFLGGILFSAALLLGSRFGENPLALFWSTGVLFGVGLALVYICPLVTIQKWFPRYKGVATGLVVALYGSSGIIMAAVARALLARGIDAFGLMKVFGIAAACGIVPLALVLSDPPVEPAAVRRSRFPRGVLRTGRFWALAAGYFAGTAAGLSFLGSIERIGRTHGTPERWLLAGVMVFTAGNTIGRIAWGAITEVFGTRRAVVVALGTIASCMAGMVFLGGHGAAFVGLTFLIGFGYGSNFVLYVADVSRTYGPDRVGSVYGLVGLAYIASGFIGPPAAGASFDETGSYVPSLLGAAALVVVGAGVFLALYGQPVDETTPEATTASAA